MIKKLMWLLSIVGVLSFSSCGGGSSNEAKELLSKILQFVGIPQTIVANICQDENRDGICGGGELFTKVIISKGDKIDDIWKKILLTDDGKYFLETYNSELPILVELQDVARVNYDDGKFTLVFDGFITKEDDNEKKEISILESMVDADALTKVEADKFRTLTNPEAQDKYYTALLESLETNINTLRNNEFDRITAMSATIIEMADETRVNQAQADRINACGNNQTCVDKEIKKLFDELIITENEVLEIKAKQETNNNTTSNNNSNQNKIDLADYKPNRSMTKNYIGKYKLSDKFGDESKEEKTFKVKEEITVKDNIISMVSTASGDIDTTYTNTFTINENSIEWTNKKDSTVINRYVNVGDISLDAIDESCTLVAELTTFSHGGYEYSGDIIKEKCIGYVVLYQYYKKDLGLIATIHMKKNNAYDYYNFYYIK